MHTPLPLRTPGLLHLKTPFFSPSTLHSTICRALSLVNPNPLCCLHFHPCLTTSCHPAVSPEPLKQHFSQILALNPCV